jgi:uncharacterized iron-regulated membrane protein
MLRSAVATRHAVFKLEENYMLMTRSIPCLLGALLLAAGCSVSTEHPPSGSKPLSEILQGVEKSRPGTVVSADFEDRLWEVVVCDSGGRNCREVFVDPVTGQERRSGRESNWDIRAPAGGKTAAQIARSIEDRRLGVITELEYDDPVWEVTVRADGGRAKLYVDPVSADIRRCVGAACPPRS